MLRNHLKLTNAIHNGKTNHAIISITVQDTIVDRRRALVSPRFYLLAFLPVFVYVDHILHMLYLLHLQYVFHKK